MSTEADVATATLKLPASLRIADVGEVRALCDAALAGAGPLVCEAEQLEQVDAAGLQLLVALSRACAAGDRGFELRAPSEALISAARSSGFAAPLGLA